MSKLYHFTLYFKGEKTYTARTYEEALDELVNEYGDVEVSDCDTEEFDPYEDDYLS